MYSLVNVSTMYLQMSPLGAHLVFMAEGTSIIWMSKISLWMSLPRALFDTLP